ncbi:uncharacterized protein LOC112057287 [Bicyclus anynana]|uniref:Uncharacterized protein LOC112057287 n=1 Tax=Bicyclus anynana TaxID=110368 RepID=A0ABM3M682_BICAN|nr:uncharacterized protein LOC112057287 [Bicyclus anynana]
MSLLQINNLPEFDNSIESYEIHTYNPYNNSFNENDEIRIPIHQQDIYVLPSASSIYIEGNVSVTHKDQAGKVEKKSVDFSNNAFAFLFQDIRYEINGVEIDRVRNAGITTTIKSYISMNSGESKAAAVWGWGIEGFKNQTGSFNALIPLNKILGFAEDYDKIIINCKHELILNRGSTNLNSIIMSNDDIVDINIQRIQWRVPHIKVSDQQRLMLLRKLEKDNPIQIAFRNWDLYEYPLLPKTTKHSWAVKTASQLEKPRYVIFGLQTNRKNIKIKDSTIFDHCTLTNVTLFLNSHYYPYDALNLKFSDNKYSILYDMYSKFRQSFYNLPIDPLLDLHTFKEKAPLFVIDCSRQNENLKTGPVDVRLEIETSQDIPSNTSAYCLIINDRLVEYRPLSNIVRKLS